MSHLTKVYISAIFYVFLFFFISSLLGKGDSLNSGNDQSEENEEDTSEVS